MPAEPKIIFEATGCPNPPCNHNKVTVSELGCADAKKRGKIEKDAFTKLAAEVIPIEQPMVAGVMVEAIAVYYDVCSLCGTRYCTRSELIKIPVKGPPIPTQTPGKRQGYDPFRNFPLTGGGRG